MATILTQFNYSTADVRRVRRVQFGVLSPEEVKSMSVVEVVKPGTFNGGVPIKGGLNDPLLGASDPRSTCSTCKNTYAGSGKINECPGHFGHIEKSPAFIQASKIRNGKKRLHAMRRLCCKGGNNNTCRGSSVPSAEGAAGEKDDNDLMNVEEGGESSNLDAGCGALQPKFRRRGLKVELEFPEGKEEAIGLSDRKQILTPERAYQVFRNISDEDARLLGLDPRYARPEWLILTVLPVPPPHVRPSVDQGTGTRGEDDITHKLSEIVKANIAVANAKRSGQPAITVEQFELNLQYHCATLIDNQLPGQPAATQRGGKTLKAFRERLVGKGGRVRGNLMGKRVDFSARTVITADPILSIHQVGVPRSIAANLTVPERVNRYNLARLQKLVENGPFNHPGAKFIIRENGLRVDLRFASSTSELALKEGWIVERHLMDDDTVLFNRQPTLHKMSIMCHRVKVLDYSTFRMNLTCTTPYNADFDGDEMNLHALQTLPAIAEAQELMAVPRLIITAQGNRPVMGIVQDTLLGSRLFTKRDVFLNRDMVYNEVLWMTPWGGKVPQPAIMKPNKKKPGQPGTVLWTGKQMFSMFIPNVNYSKNSQGAPDVGWNLGQLWPDDTRVLIERGQLLTGILDKASLGNKGGSLLHVIMNDVSPEDCRDFINNCQRVVNYWLLHRGFSIGIGDSEAPSSTMKKVSTIIKEAKESVHGMVAKGQAGKLKRQPGQSMMQSFEALVNECLNKARDQASKAVTEVLDESNAVVAMVSAGSKGSNINISQIIACVGQQNVEGKRIPYGFRDRTLPHFCKFDLGPQARGFVENSYLKGLTPSEFFFHMMGGREGLIDTAVKTAETGYTQRRLVKAMEDVMVRYDCTVRNSSNQVVQFLYGDDGMDGRWIEDVEFPSWKLSGGRLREAFGWDPDAPDFGRASAKREFYLDPEVADNMKQNMDTRDALAREFELIEASRSVIHASFSAGRRMEKGDAPMPVNVGRLLLNCAQKFGMRHDGMSDLHPVVDVIEPVNALLKRLVIVPGKDALAREAQSNATCLLEAMLRAHLASKPIIARWRLSRDAFRWLLGEVESRFFTSHAAAGEMCGVLAAQSIGEPTTQMTLNTFHYAGVSAKNVTLGVPRLKELINVAKSIKTPSVTIFVKEHLRGSPDAYTVLQRALEYTTLGDLVEETQILYDPDPTATVVPEDADWVAIHAAVPEADVNFAALSPWVLRLRLSREAMVRKSIRFREIKDKVREVDPTLYIIENDDNADVPVLRIRISNSTGGGAAAASLGEDPEAAALRAAMDAGGDEDERTLKDFEQLLLYDLPLRGIPHIRKLYSSAHKGWRWSPEGGLEPIKNVEKFETEGTNLMPILSHPDVDMPSTVSNDVIEIMQVLGIEACRQALFNELKNVISFDGSYVNYRHLAILVDSMTFRGYLTAVTRHGINRVESGPLMRSSFEETCEILMDAAVFSEFDPMRGVSDNVLLGQLCPIGTGHFDLFQDEEKLKDAIPVGAAASDLLTMMMGSGGVGVNNAYIVGQTPLMASPDAFSPLAESVYAGAQTGGAMFSPTQWTPTAGATPAFSPAPSAMSPSYLFSPAPGMSPSYGLMGDMMGSSPGYAAVATPNFTPTENSAGSGGWSPASAQYSPTQGAAKSPYGGGESAVYSPTSPYLSPTSPFYGSSSSAAAGGASYSPTSPAYSPTSPAYASADKSGGGGGAYSPTSPAYSPTSPAYGSRASPAYSPTSTRGGGAGGMSPSYSPTSPALSPTSPAYSPQGGGARGGGGISPAYSPTSPFYSDQGSSGVAYSPAPSSAVAASAATSGTGGVLSSSSLSQPSSPGRYSPSSVVLSPSSSLGGGGGGASSVGGYSPTSNMMGGASPVSSEYNYSGGGDGAASVASSGGSNYSPSTGWSEAAAAAAAAVSAADGGGAGTGNGADSSAGNYSPQEPEHQK